MADFDLESHHLRLLTLAAEAFDRGTEARETLRSAGTYYRNASGEPRLHPAAGVERDSRIAFARMVREMGLDGAPEPDPRPPGIGGR